MAVGVALVSSRDLLEDGMRGKGVMIYHVYQDLLWFVSIWFSNIYYAVVTVGCIWCGCLSTKKPQVGFRQIACRNSLVSRLLNQIAVTVYSGVESARKITAKNAKSPFWATLYIISSEFVRIRGIPMIFNRGGSHYYTLRVLTRLVCQHPRHAAERIEWCCLYKPMGS